jgi:hypothetical protein
MCNLASRRYLVICLLDLCLGFLFHRILLFNLVRLVGYLSCCDLRHWLLWPLILVLCSLVLACYFLVFLDLSKILLEVFAFADSLLPGYPRIVRGVVRLGVMLAAELAYAVRFVLNVNDVEVWHLLYGVH